MPLTRGVEFRAVLQKGHRIQVPRLVRWEFKLEPSQVLKVGVKTVSLYGRMEYFFGRMNRDGRITIPEVTLGLLQDAQEGKSVVGRVMEVELQPSGSSSA